jgi:hypothetical protein
MARSPHSYVRGNTIRYYEWLERAKRGALPQGPEIWICGDCHVGNFGPVGNARGNIEIQIRDFDQTVTGKPLALRQKRSISRQGDSDEPVRPGAKGAARGQKCRYDVIASTTFFKAVSAASISISTKARRKAATNNEWIARSGVTASSTKEIRLSPGIFAK